MPSINNHPYRGLWAAIATMHGKERAIAPPLRSWFELVVTTVPEINTDALGTFTGEIARPGTMLDAARAKAKLAIERTGAPLGIGSEGAFGPDPLIPFIASGRELIVMIEAETGLEIVVQRRTPTNFYHIVAAPGTDISAFLTQMKFPEHAVVVRPDGPGNTQPISKGIADFGQLKREIERIARISSSGHVRVQTDMRAHLNPTRMAAIARTTRWLALRTARCCPSCPAPGFGVIDALRGLPCHDCSSPTRLIRAEIHGCTACGMRLTRRERDPRLKADPTWCQFCNP